MSTNVEQAARYILELLKRGSGEQLLARFAPRTETKRERFLHGNDATPEALQGRWAMLEAMAPGTRTAPTRFSMFAA